MGPVLALNRDEGERVAQQLRGTIKNARASVLAVDLGSLASVRQAAEHFRARWSKLDLLINNAGVMATPQGYTPDGFELQWGSINNKILRLLVLHGSQHVRPLFRR